MSRLELVGEENRIVQENAAVGRGDVTRGEIEILHESVAWSSPSARVLEARVRLPAIERGGHVEGRLFRLDHAEDEDHGVVVAPITRDDQILLVRQFRHPIRMWVRELPRGSRHRGEPPADAAARELREEVGCTVEATYPLGRIANDSGQVTGLPYLYAARVTRAGESDPDSTEAIDGVFGYSYSELKRACQTGAIIDSFTLAAVARLEPHFRGDRFEYRPESAPSADT